MELPLHHSDWILVILLVSMALLVAARLYNPERFTSFASLPFHVKRKEMELAFNPIVARGLFDVSMSISSYLVLAMSVYIGLHNSWNEEPYFTDSPVFYRILLILVLFYLVKNLSGLLVGWVFERTDEIARSQNAQLAHRAWLGVILLPLVILAVFNTSNYVLWYWLTLSVLIIGVVLSLYFSFIQLWRIGVSSYYKIFYLCALEITPLVFLVGWLKSLSQ